MPRSHRRKVRQSQQVIHEDFQPVPRRQHHQPRSSATVDGGTPQHRFADVLVHSAQEAPAAPEAVTAAHDRAPSVPDLVWEATRQPGSPLPEDVRSEMEAIFGRDLSEVRVHYGRVAREAAQAVDAAAFSVGSEIVVDAHSLHDSPANRTLLAHEVAHVVQQPRTPDGPDRLRLGHAAERAEAEAEAAAEVMNHHATERAGAAFDARLRDFRAGHTDATLDRWRRLLGEPQVDISQSTPLGTIRRMGRSRRRSSREEALERVRLTDDDTYVRDVINFFYPGMYSGPINEDAKRLAAHLLHAATEQSRAFDFVPRPPGRPSPGWLLKEGVQAAYRVLRDEGIYEAVRVNVARNYRTALEELRNGIPVTL